MDVAYYGQPRVGANMHSPLNCLPGTGWTMGEPQTTRVGDWDVREVQVTRGRARFAMAYWFQSRARIESDEIAARLHLLGDALRRRPTDASVVRLIVPATDVPAADHAKLTGFAAQLIPAIGDLF
jgi:EpsI family protein